VEPYAEEAQRFNNQLGNLRSATSSPMGAWAAVYIIEGLPRNESDIQPGTVHANTQGQLLPVFGLAASGVPCWAGQACSGHGAAARWPGMEVRRWVSRRSCRAGSC
jgi:Tn3 transposase DDE domain